MLDWIQANETLLSWLVVVSVVTFLVSLIAIPWIVVRIPADYFSHAARHRTSWADRHPAVRYTLLIMKNVLGLILILAGMVMLVLPGQGLLSIAIGIMLMNFPGKYKLECWIVNHKLVLQLINWFRQRAHCPPLVVEEESETGNR